MCIVCKNKTKNGCPFCNENYVSPPVKELLSMSSEEREAHVYAQSKYSEQFDFEIFEANELYEYGDEDV